MQVESKEAVTSDFFSLNCSLLDACFWVDESRLKKC